MRVEDGGAVEEALEDEDEAVVLVDLPFDEGEDVVVVDRVRGERCVAVKIEVDPLDLSLQLVNLFCLLVGRLLAVLLLEAFDFLLE